MTLSVYQPEQTQAITITAKAIQFFQKKLQSEAKKAIRLSVKKSGCTGYAYVIDYGETQAEGDTAHDYDGLAVFISVQAMEMISGSEIDLEQQGLNKNIVFNNPNVTASCGCGSSFSVDEENI